MNVVVCGQVESENSSLPVTVRVSKMRVLKLPNVVAQLFIIAHAEIIIKVEIKVIGFG